MIQVRQQERRHGVRYGRADDLWTREVGGVGANVLKRD